MRSGIGPKANPSVPPIHAIRERGRFRVDARRGSLPLVARPALDCEPYKCPLVRDSPVGYRSIPRLSRWRPIASPAVPKPASGEAFFAINHRKYELDTHTSVLPMVLTGHGERSRVLEAVRSGVHEFLLKPVSRAALKARLLSVLGRGDRQQQSAPRQLAS